MKLNLYSIYDSAAAYYKNPWCANTDDQARREFADIFHGDNPIAAHPEHYYLMKLGTFNNDTGRIITPDNRVETLITGLEALAENTENAKTQNDLFKE